MPDLSGVTSTHPFTIPLGHIPNSVDTSSIDRKCNKIAVSILSLAAGLHFGAAIIACVTGAPTYGLLLFGGGLLCIQIRDRIWNRSDKSQSSPARDNSSSSLESEREDSEAYRDVTTSSSFTAAPLRDVALHRPFVPGQPVGIRNGSANCWANSLLQFARHIPSLYRIVQADRELQPAFANFYRAYDRARATQQHTAPQASSQTIRQCLHARSDTISSRASRQEDAHEGLMAMMENFPPHYMRLQRAANDGRIEPTTVISINPTDHKRRSLAELFEQTYAIRDYGPRSEFAYFQTRPDELFFHIARFRPTLAGFTKNSDLLNIGPIFSLPARRVDAENGGGDYLCDAFIEHRGSSASGGHYVAYVMDEDGRWWLCNDQVITAVTEATVNSARQRAYILHFRAI